MGRFRVLDVRLLYVGPSSRHFVCVYLWVFVCVCVWESKKGVRVCVNYIPSELSVGIE